MALGRLHGRDDAVDADDAVAARPLRLPPHLHRRGRRCSWSAAWSAASARTFELVLAMRVAEGLAAGVLQPIPAIVILHAFGEGERGKAMGIFGFGVVLAPGARAERRRHPGRVVRLALDLLRRHAVLPRRDGDGAALPADRRARRRADQPRRRPARRRRPRPDRGRRARAAQRHGPPARATTPISAWRCSPAASSPPIGFVFHQRRGAAAADGARPVRPSRLLDGRHWSPSSTAWRCSARPTWCRCSCRRRCTCRRRRPARCCCRPGSPWR